MAAPPYLITMVLPVDARLVSCVLKRRQRPRHTVKLLQVRQRLGLCASGVRECCRVWCTQGLTKMATLSVSGMPCSRACCARRRVREMRSSGERQARLCVHVRVRFRLRHSRRTPQAKYQGWHRAAGCKLPHAQCGAARRHHSRRKAGHVLTRGARSAYLEMRRFAGGLARGAVAGAWAGTIPEEYTQLGPPGLNLYGCMVGLKPST